MSRNNRLSDTTDNTWLKRSRLETFCDIIETLPAKKTRIMYKANLSHVMLQKFLGYLTLRGLIYEDDKGIWQRTDKCIELLNAISTVKRILGETHVK